VRNRRAPIPTSHRGRDNPATLEAGSGNRRHAKISRPFCRTAGGPGWRQNQGDPDLDRYRGRGTGRHPAAREGRSQRLADEMRRRRARSCRLSAATTLRWATGTTNAARTRISGAEAASTPWQFAYILRGGWSQAKRELDNLRDFNRADLLLFVIALRQIVSLDAGCTPAEITEGVVRLAAIRIRCRMASIYSADRRRCCPACRSGALTYKRRDCNPTVFVDRKDPHLAAAVALLRDACRQRAASPAGCFMATQGVVPHGCISRCQGFSI